jgi:AraC-like DNA-binding protein
MGRSDVSDSTLASWALVLWKALESYRLAPQDLFRKAGLDSTRLQDANARYPYPRMQQLWHLATEACGDPCFGLRVAEFCHPTTFHALGYAWMASANLAEALQRLVRYQRMMSTVLSMELIDEASSIRLRWNLANSESGPAAAPESADASVAVVVGLARQAAGDAFSPQRVLLQRPQPSCADRFFGYFRAPVEFSSADTALVFPRAAIEAALPTANADLARANEQVIHDYLARFDRSSVGMLVRAKLVEQLPSGGATEESVAEALHLSPRTLQRKLREEGTGFKQILEDMRRQLAIQYVQNSQMSLNEITYLLGFSEPSNFTRAFRRWTGVAPSAYRTR